MTAGKILVFVVGAVIAAWFVERFGNADQD